MTPAELRSARKELGLTQEELARKLGSTRMTVTRYELGTRRIPPIVDVVIKQLLSTPVVPMLGVVAAGRPIEPVPQAESVEIPPSMVRKGNVFVLRIKGDSMIEEGILPGDLVVVQKQTAARNGQTIVASVNGETTIKKYYQRAHHIELHPANATMQPIVVKPDDEFQIEGILIGVIRHCDQ